MNASNGTYKSDQYSESYCTNTTLGGGGEAARR